MGDVMKYCPHCETSLSDFMFTINRAKPDGLQVYCKPCTHAYQINHQRMTRPTPPPRPDDTWRAAAACRGMDPDVFFPDRGELAQGAKDVCAVCTVRIECLNAGLWERQGVWGGLSERQRRNLRRQQRRSAAA